MNADFVLRLLRKLIVWLSVNKSIRAPGYLMRKLFLQYPRRVCVKDFNGNLALCLSLQEHMQSMIFWNGYYNLDIIPLIKRILAPGMVVVDAGANIGEISLVAGQLVGQKGQVIAFEPLDSFAGELERNAQQNNLHWVKIVRMALSDSQRELPLFVQTKPFSDGSIHQGLGTLFHDLQRCDPVAQVTTIKLDDYVKDSCIPRLDLLKIDIEGSELPCLRGALGTIRRFHPLIIVEVQTETARNAGYEAREILDFLRENGYFFYRILRDGAVVTMDVADLQPFQNVLCVPVGRTL